MGFDDVVDFLSEGWDYFPDGLSYVFTFEWVGDMGEFFSTAFEMATDLGSSPLTNFWFWVFYACLLAGVWYLPGAMGLADYTFLEKMLYTVVFFIVDWVIISNFMD